MVDMSPLDCEKFKGAFFHFSPLEMREAKVF